MRRQIMRRIGGTGVKVFFVTHLYDFAHAILYDKKVEILYLLRAERMADGARTFRLFEEEPLQTSTVKISMMRCLYLNVTADVDLAVRTGA